MKVTACQGNQLHNLEFGTLNPTPDLGEGERGWRLNQSASGQQMKQSCLGNAGPIKPQRLEFKELLLDEHVDIGKSGVLGRSSMLSRHTLPCASLPSGSS